jgi:hypothetical protein
MPEMTFRNVDVALSLNDIAKVETEISLTLPEPLRNHYLRWNGGQPEPCVYEDETIDTIIAEILPLKSGAGRGTASKAYRTLVLEKKIMPKHFFPFAVDGGGDYFFADCSNPDARVYFFRGDYWLSDREKCVVDLSVNFEGFLTHLKPE